MTEKKFTFDEINNFNAHLPIKLTKNDNYHEISKSLEKKCVLTIKNLNHHVRT